MEFSRRKPSINAYLQIELEWLRADVAKMTETYNHLHTKNVELEHDCRTLKCNWKNICHQLAQHDDTQGVEHPLPNQPAIYLDRTPTQTRPDKGKSHLHPEVTKSWPVQISPPKDQPYALTKAYKDCRDCISELQPKPIQIPKSSSKITQANQTNWQSLGKVYIWNRSIHELQNLQKKLNNRNETKTCAKTKEPHKIKEK